MVHTVPFGNVFEKKIVSRQADGLVNRARYGFDFLTFKPHPLAE